MRLLSHPPKFTLSGTAVSWCSVFKTLCFSAARAYFDLWLYQRVSKTSVATYLCSSSFWHGKSLYFNQHLIYLFIYFFGCFSDVFFNIDTCVWMCPLELALFSFSANTGLHAYSDGSFPALLYYSLLRSVSPVLINDSLAYFESVGMCVICGFQN